MARWILLGAAIVTNVLVVLVALAPGLVTYAEVQPSGITCATCTSEAYAALVRAAAIGRAQIQGHVTSNTWLILALALANLIVVGALFWMLRSNSAPQPDAREASRV